MSTKTRLDLEKLHEAGEKEAARRAEVQTLAEEKEAEETQEKVEEDANMKDMGGADPELLWRCQRCIGRGTRSGCRMMVPYYIW